MADKQQLERRAVHVALSAYLLAAGWAGANALTYREGWTSDQPIVPPTIAITLIKPNKRSLQMGTQSEKLFFRTLQIDAYMESEQRAAAICDLVMDFMDLVPITVTDFDTSVIGTFICQNTDSIVSDIIPPILTNPKSIRWRGVIKGIYEAHYPNG